MNYFKSEADLKLPEVCEPGAACREEIYAEARQQLKVEWSLTLSEIQGFIDIAVLDTASLLEAAYSAAYECHHGCECKEIDGTYVEIRTRIETKMNKIAQLEDEINVILNNIKGAD